MNDWELSLRIIALGHQINVASGFQCPRCQLTLSDILRGDRMCLSEPVTATEAVDPAGERDQPEGGAAGRDREGDS